MRAGVGGTRRAQAWKPDSTEDFFYEVASGKPRAPCTLSGTALGRIRVVM
ncbi:hypothetical protein BRPE64_ACDS04990 [Caballeronia insecticola]|uniref:Uncharacterized protein n=1 Tax=Caballeronia insecticola TaxID=758793 RepID=R4WFA7_9BURK|nr:hypothetical protein BRPE64_ACDS04990 [Caballeronia insecticola]